MKAPIVNQLICFAGVGVMAAAVNILVVYIMVELTHISPIFANVLAFLVAFVVSFLGHRYLTFSNTDHAIVASITRFFTVAVSGFFLTEVLYYIFLHFSHLHYIASLICVLLIVPPITFMASKFWAFK